MIRAFLTFTYTVPTIKVLFIIKPILFNNLYLDFIIITSYPIDNYQSVQCRSAREMTEKPFCVATSRAGPVLCIHQVAHRITFLSRQRDIIAFSSFGGCTVQTDFYQLLIFVDICQKTASFENVLVPMDNIQFIDHYGFTWAKMWWIWPYYGRF